MENLTKGTAKIAGAAKAIGKALSGYPAIFRHLSGEHGEVATLIKRVAGSSDDPQIRAELFPEIRRSLLAHAKAEEKEFYEPLREFSQTSPLITQAIEEHRRIERFLDELQRTKSGPDASWLATFQNFMRAVEAHVQHEEEQLFPIAKDLLTSEQAAQIDKRYEAAEDAERARL
jgi:hemerythrin superfamily protein